MTFRILGTKGRKEQVHNQAGKGKERITFLPPPPLFLALYASIQLKQVILLRLDYSDRYSDLVTPAYTKLK